MHKTILILILLLALDTPRLSAQEIEMYPLPLESQLIGILGMAQDDQGYVWIADNGGGLVKYGGAKEVYFKPNQNDPNSLISGRIENIYIDPDGMIWLPTFDAGLDMYNPHTNTFTHYQHDPEDPSSIRSNGVRDIVEDSLGNLWIGTNRGVDKFDRSTGSFKHHLSDTPSAQQLDAEQIRDLYIDRGGILWIGTGSPFETEESYGGLYSLDPANHEVTFFEHKEGDSTSLIDNRIRAIFEDSRGTFWVGTAGDGLHTMDRENGTFTRHTYDPDNPNRLSRSPQKDNFPFGDDHITFIEEDDRGGIWIGTFENGISHYDASTGQTNHYNSSSSSHYIQHDNYWRSLKTRDGLLWFAGFLPRGKIDFVLNADVNKVAFPFVPNDPTYSFAQRADGTLLIGTSEGVQVRDVDGNTRYLFKTGSIVIHMLIDKKNRIWASTLDLGLFSYDTRQGKLIRFSTDSQGGRRIESNWVGSSAETSDGEIVIGTQAGLEIIDADLNVRHRQARPDVNIEFGLSYYRGKQLYVDSQERLWMGHYYGLYQIDLVEGTHKDYDWGGIGRQIAVDIHEDNRGTIWIGTTGHGLQKYLEDQDTFLHVTNESIYLRHSQRAVTSVENGDLWLIGRFGLQKLNPETLAIRAYEDRKTYTFDLEPASLFTTADGNVLATAIDGYFDIDVSALQDITREVEMPFVGSMNISGQRINELSYPDIYYTLRKHTETRLQYDQNDLTFEICLLDYSNNETNEIEYKLEGYDSDWRTCINGYAASYFQLQPGAYTLLLRSLGVSGEWNQAVYPILIYPPWYKTTWARLLFALLLLALLILAYRAQRARIVARERAKAKDREIEQAREISKAYAELKSTQEQLIHSEKMASLGELTAGIAHEIQNPLNFVNNFSEVSTELIDDMSEEIEAGNLTDVKEITSDLRQNLEKIQHHGQRASGIVKGMLEHSRTGDGVREPTDINALLDEYVRLAYHGLRAKDKSFQADFSTDLDPSLPRIKVVPQDIGRVFLNLINNAFYAVSTEANASVEHYQPTVNVSTKRLHPEGEEGASIEIRISDNGPGIPDKIKDKIFQPFFTTKPTGSGTGLGLSLSYDIVKAHGGTLEVKSSEEAGTEFILQIPVES